MKKAKRLLSLFLCLLMLVSVFAVDASAIQYVGGDSTIGSASSGSSDGFAIWDGDLGNQFYIVGYRFSAIDAKGNTLDDGSKYRVIDLIRFGEYKEGSSIVKWGTSAYDTNRMAGDMRETRWLTTRNNKFQWAQAYKNGSGSIGVKTTTGKTANNSTMGLYYAQASYREDNATTNGTKPSSYSLSYKTTSTVLPYTTKIKSWMKDSKNFEYVAKALGFSNASASNLAGTFGADKRILIEPLIRIMFNGTYILLSVTDAAIISMPSFGEGGRTSWIGDYTNRQFPQALYIDQTLGLPYNYPVTPITSTKSKGSYWTNKEIVTTGLGGAVAWVETDPPVNFNKLNIIYNVGDGSVSSNTYSVNSSGNVTKGGSLFKQVKYPYEKIDLYNKTELGITAPTGYHNTANYKIYSYSSGGTAYIRKYGQDDNSRTSENFWKNIYYDATSDGSNSASAGWRYIKSSGSYTQAQALSKYSSDRTVYVYPIYEPNTLTVVYNGNGATSGSMANQTFTYDQTKALTTNSFSRTGFTFLGWATSKNGNVVYTDKKSVKASTLSNKIISNESTTITLYAVWRSNNPVAKIGVRYSTALGDAKQTTSFSHTLAGLGHYGGTTVNNAVNSSGVVTSTGSLDYDFIYYEADSKKIPYVQNFNGKVDTVYTYGLTDYTTFGLSRTGNTPLKASDELGVDGSISGSVWGYNAKDYYVDTDKKWHHTDELRFFNESEPLTIEGFWRTASAPVYAGNARKVSSVEFYSTGGTKLDLSECSINSQGDGATLVVTRTLPELEMSNGYTPYKWVSTFIWRKTGNNATTGKAEFSWFLDKTVRYCFKDNGSNQAVIYKLTVDYKVPEKDSGLTGATYVTDTLFGGFSLYCDKNPSYSDYIDASGDSNAYLPTFNLYAQWVNSYSRFYINYNINGGTVKNTSAGYGKTNYYAPNIDAVSVVTKNGEIVSSEIPVIPNQTTFNKSLQNYETFGLVRDGYGTNKTWRFVTKQYELNANTGVLCFIDGATKYSIHQDTVITSTQTLFNGLSDSDNQSTIMRIGYYKADGTKYSNSELRDNDTVYSNGDYCDIFALSGVSDTDKAYQIRLHLEYQSSSKKWVCTKMYQYWFEGVAKRGLTSSFDDENAIQVFRETQYGVGTGSSYEHKFAGLLPYWDGISGTHSKISGTDVYFTQNTTNAKYRESLPIFTLSATWSPNILKFVNYKYQATSSDGNYKTSESDVGVMGDVITETYSGNGIKAPEMKAPFGYRLVRERWSPKTGVDTITGISPNSTIYFKSGDNTINDNNIHITSDQNYWCGNQNYFEAENVQVDSETGATTLTLYNAVVPNILTVSYNNNGGSGTLGKQYGIHSDDITLHSSGMTKSGYELVGWNTAADGSGDEYSLGQTVNAVGLNGDIGTQDCTVTLYAVWAPLNVIPRIIYRYNSNGGDVTVSPYALGTTSAVVGQIGNSDNSYNYLYNDEVMVNEEVVVDEGGKGAIKCITYASAGMKKDGYVPKKTDGSNVWYTSVNSYTYNTNENEWTYVTAKYCLKENTEYEVVDFLNHIGHKLDVNGNEIADFRVSSASVTDTTTKVTVVYPLEQNHGYALYKTIYTFECIDSVWYLSSQANYYYRGGKSFTKTATADIENLASFTKTGNIEGFAYKCIDMDAAFANVNYLNSTNVETYTFYADWQPASIDYYKVLKSLNTATGGYTESSSRYDNVISYDMSGIAIANKSTVSTGYRRVNAAWAVDKNGTVATDALVGGNKLFIKEDPEKAVDGTNVYADVSYKNGTAFDVDNITINNKTTASESSVFGFSLYDVIIQNKLTVNYNANGGTGTAPATQYSKYGASITFANNTFTKDGYEFIGWNTKADGTGTSYNAKASVTSQTLAPDIATKDCSVTLYAQWKAVNGSINVSLTRDTTSNYSVKSTEALNGYTFTLYKKNASGAYVKVTDAATNTSGNVSFTGLEYGAYKVEPKQPTTSLYITDASKEITVNSQTANSASFLLHNKGNIAVTLSYDATAWASGTTATVGLYSNSGCTTLIESKSVAVSSSASGSVTFTGLATKNVAYYLKVTTSINCHTWSTISAVAAGDIAAATNYTVAKTSKLTPAHDGTVKVSVTRGSDAYLSSTSVAGLQFAVYGVKSDNSEVKLSTITTTGSATSSTGSYTVSIKNGGSYKSYVVKPVSTFADTHISIAAKSATSVDVATLRNVLHGHDFTANFEVTTDSVGSITVRVDKAAYMPDDDDLSSLTMKVTLKQGSTTIRTETVTVGNDGKVVLNDLSAGEYTVTLSGVNAPYVVESTNPQTATVTTGGNTSVVFVVGARGTIIARNATYYYQSFLTAGNVTAIGGISLYRDSEHKTAETDVTRSLGTVNSTSYAYYAYQDTTFTKVTLSDTEKVLYVAPTNSVPDCHTVNVSTATNRDCKVSIQDILNAKNASGKHTYSVTELVLYATPCTATYNFVVHNKTDVNSGTITFKVTNNVDSTVYKSAAMTIKANTDINKSATGVSIVRMKSSSATTEYTGYTVTYSGVPAGYELVLVKGSETADMATLRSHDHTQTLEYNLVSKKDGSINVSLTRDTIGDYAVKSTEALNGYTFTAYRKNSSGVFVKVKDAVSDADGKVSFTSLEYGTYKIEPTQPSTSFYITDASKEVVINSTTPGSASFQLHNKGTIKVTVSKTEVCWFTETTVKVGLYSGNTLIEEKEATIGSSVSFTGLKTNGTAYSVKINNVPDCHQSTTPAAIGTTDILNATDYTVSRTITLNIDHSAKINLSVTKDNVARLSDISVGNLQFAVYGIKAADGTNVKVKTLTTDANGKASYESSLSAKLIYSGYYIVPVSTFADSEVHFNTNKSETVTVDALRADKHGHDADVAFNITAAPTGSIKVTIDKEDYVPDDDDLDITVTVTVYDEDGNKIAEETVNPSEDPVVTFDDLPIGDYTIKVSDPKDPYDIEDNEKEITVVDGDTEEVTFKVGVYGTIYVEPFSQSSVVFHDMTDFKKITGIALYSDEALSNLLYKKTFTAASYAENSVGNMYAIDKFTKIPLNEINKIYYVGYLGALPECHGLTVTSSKSGDIVIDDRKVSVQDILSVKDANGKHTYTAPYEIIRVNSTHKGSVEIKVINNTGAAVSGAKFTVKNSVPNTYTSATKAIATGTNTYCTLAPVLYNKMVVSGSYVDNTDYTLVPTAPEGYQLKLVSGDMSQLTLENLRVHDHKATFTYELIKNAPTKGDIVVKVSSIVNAPSQFSAKWDNPAGKTATVMLYSGTTKVASKTVTIPAKGAAANSVTFADCAFGNYNIVITNPAKDCVYIYNSKQTSSAALAHDVNSQPVEFVMTNFKHTLNIDYDNQFSESLTSAKFVVTLKDSAGKTTSVTVSKGSMTVPACDANGNKYTYTIKMSTAPTNYTLDNKVASFEGFTVNKNGNITASFEGWYIWDFSIGAKLSSAAETTKATYGGFKKGSTVVINVPVTNKRAHQNTPAVSVEVFLDKTRINAQSVTIDANSSKTLSVSVSIPASASTGAHTITAYVNYDKYSTYGEGYLYETALTDNTATLTLDVISGDVRIVPVASNSDYYIGDTVFASFYVYNDSAVDILKANNTSIGGKVLYTKTDGTSATKTLTDITGVVVPSNIYVDNRNLVFFKFAVPSDAKPNTDIAVTATIKTGTAMNEDTSNDTAVVLKKTRLHAESNTPDPGRNLSAPSGWQASCAAPNLTRYAATSTSTAIGKTAKWSVWEENTTGKLTLHTYGATATVNAIVKVDNRCLTAAISNKDLVMKSGYALTLAVQPYVTKLNETPASMLGSFGSANAYYPEFSYVKEGGKYSALNLINDDALRATSQFTAKSATPAYAATHDMSILNTASRWELPQCTFSSFYKNGAGMARKHFTPLWWKNGNYQIVCDATDFWTPAGVIGAEAVAKTTLGGTVVISGSVYDDYYTVRG